MEFTIIALYRDGGTIQAQLADGTTVYRDGRIRSETEGILFTAYPGKPEAQPYPDPEGILGAAIRERVVSRNQERTAERERREKTPFLHLPGFFSVEQATEWFDALMGWPSEDWHRVLTADDGSAVPISRAMAYAAKPEVFTGFYHYAGLELKARSFTPVLAEILLHLEKDRRTRIQANSVLLNRYDDGKSEIRWHADKEPQLGPSPTICTVNLGASRVFSLREATPDGQRYDFTLHHGDAFMMYPGCQERFVHSVLKDKTVTDPRISLTYRRVIPVRMGGYNPPRPS